MDFSKQVNQKLFDASKDPVMVIGASGYVGSRLVWRLLDSGIKVVAASRSLANLNVRPWSQHTNITLCKVDVMNQSSVLEACQNAKVIFYLVHSMEASQTDFAKADKIAAQNLICAAADCRVDRLIYLGGLGEQSSELSRHLRSRSEVAEILRSGKVPVTVLRAAMIIGSGSASFEILRYLVERLPAMVTPKWVSTECQPIDIGDVLKYLSGCLQNPETAGQTYDIGGPRVTTYRELLKIYAEEAGLPRRLIIPVPVLTPRLSSYWIHLVTPIHASIARPLAEGLSNRVVCSDSRINQIISIKPIDYRESIKLALSDIKIRILKLTDENRSSFDFPERSITGDPKWAGGKIFKDKKSTMIDASAQDVWGKLSIIGGENGWYYANWLWRLRGALDRLMGGIGFRKGRTDPNKINIGDKIDFWTIQHAVPNSRLILLAEMKLPGIAVLDFVINQMDNNRTKLILTARFAPKGLLGIAYWYAVLPLHGIVFKGMLRAISKKVEREAISGPLR